MIEGRKLLPWLAAALACAAGALAACGDGGVTPAQTGGGDPARGKLVIVRESCGSCHVIPHIQEATGEVGPPLGDFGQRTVIAGVLPNTPQNLAHWVQSPQSVIPNNAMPDSHMTDAEARDVAAFLETLR
jgi:cytochrome c2